MTGPRDVVTLDAQRARKRRNSQAARVRKRRGDCCRLIRLKKHHLDRLEMQGYLDPFKRGEHKAEIEAVECYLANTLLPLD